MDPCETTLVSTIALSSGPVSEIRHRSPLREVIDNLHGLSLAELADVFRYGRSRCGNSERARSSVLDCPEQLVKGNTVEKRNRSYDFAAQVGARIRFLRLERGFSVRKFAEIAKCCASNIPLVEMGRSSIQMRILRKFARALQVEPFDLLNVDPENNDIGYIIEKMRQDPATRKLVKEQLEAWDLRIANTP